MVSTLQFRNVEVSVDDPVETWPQEAVQTALSRGSLTHWRRLVAAIRRAPWGSVARCVEQVLTYDRPYGVAELMENSIARARSAAAEEERATIAEQMRQLARSSGMSQAEFASRIGTSRTRLSTYLSGKVTPSAALLLRAQRASEAASQERDRGLPSPSRSTVVPG